MLKKSNNWQALCIILLGLVVTGFPLISMYSSSFSSICPYPLKHEKGLNNTKCITFSYYILPTQHDKRIMFRFYVWFWDLNKQGIIYIWRASIYNSKWYISHLLHCSKDQTLLTQNLLFCLTLYNYIRKVKKEKKKKTDKKHRLF